MVKNILITSLLVLFLFGCNNQDCNLDFQKFDSGSKNPALFIRREKGKCQYEIAASFWIGSRYIESKGLLKYEDHGFKIKLNDPETSFFKLFDFKQQPEASYFVPIEWKDNFLQGLENGLEVQLEKKIEWKDGIEVFMFRVKENLLYGEFPFDIVYFVSGENGILGTYISKKSGNSETVIYPRGEVLKDYIDYSAKGEGELL